MRGVRPLRALGHIVPARRKPPARARFSRAERTAVLRESLAAPAPELDIQPGDALHYRQIGVPAQVLRRLRRGYYRVEAEIDLHGLGLVQARAPLPAVRLTGTAWHLPCVRLVHGYELLCGENRLVTGCRRASPVPWASR